MLKRLHLRDVAIVSAVDIELSGGFSVLTGETGAGKSILIDALQLALGARADAGMVREGAARAEISAEFEPLPAGLLSWLDQAGFAADESLLIRRQLDSQGKSRAWINGSVATISQLRELSGWLVDIHGQHAWQSLTRSSSVRELLDAYAGIDTRPLLAAWERWRAAQTRLDTARLRSADLERERERLAWQISEINQLAPGEHEWDELNAEHQRLAHAQAILDALRNALDALSESELSASSQTGHALAALDAVADYDRHLLDAREVLQSAQAQLQDAAHTLQGALHHTELDPDRLAELDARLSAWVSLARRHRRQPHELPATLAGWQAELAALDADTNLELLTAEAQDARTLFLRDADRVSSVRQRAAPQLAATVTAAMQELGMAGGRFEIALEPLAEPQAHGLEAIEFLVAGHAGSTPRPLAKVASGGELSRIALAIAVTTSQLGDAGTLIFDEVDAGIGGAVAHTVGRLMQQLGHDRQVLAVTHLAQVAACADQHYLVSKASPNHSDTSRTDAVSTTSTVCPIDTEQRTDEIARMLGGAHSTASLAHAREMLATGRQTGPLALIRPDR
ncbi:MAG: DNA repair protein RecN [Leptothrix sp. (in: b-proteobacteria)]